MRTKISNLLRLLGILYYTDKLRFGLIFLKTYKQRRKFKSENPEVAMPSAYLIYESFDLNYESYYTASRNSAIWLLNHFKRFYELKNINILDWGCGPARIVRHLPDLLDGTCSVFGTDYNAKSINWDKRFIRNVNFNLNDAHPPLPYVASSFDLVYGISIFTHLPESLHKEWFNELTRITKPNGVLFLTFQGNAFKQKLTPQENKVLDSGQLLVKGHTKVGHRTYAAFHPTSFIKNLIAPNLILDFIEGDVRNGKPQQDIYIIKVIKSDGQK